MSRIISIADLKQDIVFLDDLSPLNGYYVAGIGINTYSVYLTIKDAKHLHRALGKIIEQQEGETNVPGN